MRVLQRTCGRSIALGGGGAVDKQADLEAVETALDSLLAHGEDAVNFKILTTRWEKGWLMKDGEWKMKVRFVRREYKCAKHREDLFSPLATHSAGRVIDSIALKLGLESLWNTSKWSWSRQLGICNDWPELERHSFTGAAPDRLRWTCTWMSFMELHHRVSHQESIATNRVQRW